MIDDNGKRIPMDPNTIHVGMCGTVERIPPHRLVDACARVLDELFLDEETTPQQYVDALACTVRILKMLGGPVTVIKDPMGPIR